MSNNILDALPVAEQVRDATAAGENTALRVGGCLVDIITKADLDLINIQNVLAAMPTDPFDAVLDDWANHTGAQLIEFESNGTVVATLSLLLATTSYSGLMSPIDKAKIDAIPASIASRSEAFGSILATASLTDVTLAPYAIDGTALPSVNLPSVKRLGINGGAYLSGLLTASQANVLDMYGQGVEVYIAAGDTMQVRLADCPLYRGLSLNLEEIDNVVATGEIYVGVNESVTPWLNGNAIAFGGGDSQTFDVGVGLDTLTIAENVMTVASFSIINTGASDMHLRLTMSKNASNGGGMMSFGLARGATYMQLSGKDGQGYTIANVILPNADTTKAGVMSAADKTKLNSAADEQNVVGSLSVTVSASNIIITMYDASVDDNILDTLTISAATSTTAGVMSSAQAAKLAGIEAGAEKNVQADWNESNALSDAFINNKPTLGTASSYDVPATGNASTSQVVKGDDTRLTDARPASDVYPWAKAENPPTITKADIGLGNVDNTSDLNKPISTATQNALNGKQDVLPIETSSAGATLDCVADKYYVLTSTIGTFTITLPTMTDATKAHTIGLYLTTGATPALTIAGTNLIKYDAAWTIAANTTYEVNALWNGVAWVLTLIEIQ